VNPYITDNFTITRIKTVIINPVNEQLIPFLTEHLVKKSLSRYPKYAATAIYRTSSIPDMTAGRKPSKDSIATGIRLKVQFCVNSSIIVSHI